MTNPIERWKIMGYYKNMEIELQAHMEGELPYIHDRELRRIVMWDAAHRGTLAPEARWRILTNESLLQHALTVWEAGMVPAPKRAVDHVALQTRRSRRNATERQAFGRTLWFIIGLSAIPVVFFVIVAVEVF
jgi:hypothetical protein